MLTNNVLLYFPFVGTMTTILENIFLQGMAQRNGHFFLAECGTLEEFFFLFEREFRF